MNKLLDQLKGGDLRSIGKANEIIDQVITQSDFDDLVEGLEFPDRKVVMRVVDAMEKITLDKRVDFLQKHKVKLIHLSKEAKDKELKWHLALLLPRLKLSKREVEMMRDLLTKWAKDKTESKIVRVNSIQGLSELVKQRQNMVKDFESLLFEIEKENIASLKARIKKILKPS